MPTRTYARSGASHMISDDGLDAIIPAALLVRYLSSLSPTILDGAICSRDISGEK
jgi:hypothetical protein